MTPLPLAITTGDPGGVGPEVSIVVASEARHEARCVLFGDSEWLTGRATALGLAPADVVRFDARGPFELSLGKVGIADAGCLWDAVALRHEPTAAGGTAQLRALDCGLDAALAGRVRAIVTAPMSKAAVNLGGQPFSGHTEHLAHRAGLADDDVTMMFLGPRLSVALVTTHIAIADAPREVTAARVERACVHLGDALSRARDHAPSIVVAGLNPHAGEGGLFGDEESRSIAPGLRAACAREPFASGRARLSGPMPAETAFRKAASGELDGVVAMLHDQATIASKLLDWGQAVNVTWGLPFVRTSVDHGVAYDAARSRSADPEGMRSALRLALRLTGGG
jgi:4-hydroxythreonine-4-phosphate dehydrogenase